MLGEQGATVYLTGRTTRGGPNPTGSPGTIQDTADEVSERGGNGIPVQVDHTEDAQVRSGGAGRSAAGGGRPARVGWAAGRSAAQAAPASQRANRSAKRPPRARSSAGVPDSTMRPSSTTAIWSAWAIVVSR